MFKIIWIKAKKRLIDDTYIKDTIEFLTSKWKEIHISDFLHEKYRAKYPNLKILDFKTDLDLLIIFGWDWSILKANQMFTDTNMNTPVLWINMWTLWFLSEIRPNECVDRIKDIFKWKHSIDERQMLRVKVKRYWKTLIKWRALNDVVISYKDIARITHLKATIDNKVLANYKADGLIVSTTTGSTAYNMAAWWPIIYPGIPAFVLTPICSHSFNQKPIVTPNDKSLAFELTRENRNKEFSLTLDWQIFYTLKVWDTIKIKKHSKVFRFVRFPWMHFYKVIKKKLKWGETL